MEMPIVFRNAVLPYLAFNARDPWYQEMAQFVLSEVQQTKTALRAPMKSCIDLGAGTGMSTRVFAPHFKRLIAVEPDESMRQVLSLHFSGDPKITIVDGDSTNMSRFINEKVDVAACCQTFHLLKDVLDKSIAEIARVLNPYGIFACDLVPSNWNFQAYKLADHRGMSGGKKIQPDEILTEFAHPFFQKAHQVAYATIQTHYPEYERENLWPPLSKQYTRDELVSVFEQNGLELIRITETLVLLNGTRVLEKIRGMAWSIFFRWPPLDSLTIEDKIALIEPAVKTLFADPNFKAYTEMPAYCQTAIVTAILPAMR